MGKLIVVSGPNDSGKSRYAETLLSRFAGTRYYIATMVPQTADNRVRIEKHRRQRAGLGFQTLEIPGPVGGAPVSPDAAVLLEDVSNLLANALFARHGTADAVFADILALRARCALLCAVTISGLVPEVYEGETAAYTEALNRLNQQLMAAADAVAAQNGGATRVVKGEIDGFFTRDAGCVFDIQRDPGSAL